MGTLLDQCSGTVIVHTNRRFTCSYPSCEDATIGRRMLDRHGWFVACSEALGPDCPLCTEAVSGAESGPEATTPASTGSHGILGQRVVMRGP